MYKVRCTSVKDRSGGVENLLLYSSREYSLGHSVNTWCQATDAQKLFTEGENDTVANKKKDVTKKFHLLGHPS